MWTLFFLRKQWPFWIFIILQGLLLASTALAADKNGVSPNTISLPKGPGSIEGLGESFQPTLNTGTAKYAVGLKLPPGVGGHNPELSINYEGGDGNGPLGIGWQMPLPFVQRRTDRGIPTYGQEVNLNREDAYINHLKEELVPQASGYFFCKNEGAFIRYRQISNHWEGTLPDGTILQFGINPQARIEDPASGRIFAWLLEREIDIHGNAILYSYVSFGGFENTNQKYLANISYGPGSSPWNNFHFVTFTYEDRADWFEDCRAGFVVRTGKRLHKILVGTHGPSLTNHAQIDLNNDGTLDNLVRSYELDYLSGTNSLWSLLAAIRFIGSDGMTALPSSSFAYTASNPPDEISAEQHEIGSINTPAFLMGNALVELADLNGDALPDILKTGGGQHRVFLNQGEVMDGTSRSIKWSGSSDVGAEFGQAWGFDLSSNATHMADMDGDGLADFVHKASFDNVFYFANSGTVSWSARRPMAVSSHPPPAPFDDARVRTADVDFDKRIDLIRGDGIEYHIWFNLGQNRYSDRVRVLPNVPFDFVNSSVQMADFNGDRVPDIVRVLPEGVKVSTGLGYGRFIDPVTVGINLTLEPAQLDKAKLTDINGDGLADLVIERVAARDLWYWLNLGNYTFSSRKVITGMPTGVGNAATRWADLNGNGSTDLVYSDQQSSFLRTVDLGELMNGGANPNVLVAITNGLGKTTLIGYRPSTDFAVADAKAGRPWPDPMPFPINVVAAVTNLDSLGHQYVSTFNYHDGYYDAVEKQFRGFAEVEQIDIGDDTAPALVTRSHFDTGRFFEVMKGKLLRVTTEQEDGRVFSDESTAWTDPPVTLMTGTNGQTVTFTHPLSSVKLIKELDQGSVRQLEAEYAYDRFGNETTNANYGVVVNGDRSVLNDERVVTTVYAVNTNAWLLRCPRQQEIRDETGAVISRIQYFYDDETFSGSNPGLVTIGNLTLKREWISPTNDGATINSVRTKFDSFGNPVAILDPLALAPGGNIDFSKGHARILNYDDRFHTYPVTETIHIGGGKLPLVFQASYNEGFGTITKSIDFNSQQTTFGYDPISRLNRIVRPGDTDAYPTVEYDYALAVPFSTGLVNYVESRQLDKLPGSANGGKRAHYFISRSFVDGLGRKLMTKQEAGTAPSSGVPRVAIKDAVLFNARQQPFRQLNPCFSSHGGSTLDDLLGYEAIENPGWAGLFQENGTLVTLNLLQAHQVTTRFDATLRVVETENPDHTRQHIVYEPLLTRTYDENDTDPNSQFFQTPMVHQMDGLGRLVRVDETARLNDDGTAGPLRTWITLYEYNLNDQLAKIIDSQNNIKTFGYDGLLRKTSLDDCDRGIMTFAYDDASNLTESYDAKQQRITYTYDGANRILTEDYHDEGMPFSHHFVFNPNQPISAGNRPDVAYFYDTPTPNLDQGDGTFATAANTKGKLAAVWDLSGEEHTSYDARDRVDSVVKRVRDPIYHQLVSYRTGFSYDSLDRVIGLTYPDKDSVGYQYNDRNLLQKIIGGPNGSIISNVTYWPSDQQGEIVYGNGIRTTYAYDSRLRLNSLITAPQSAPQTPLISFGYEFDGVSNIKSIVDRRPGAAVPEGDPRRNTQLFQYDDLYRLTRVQYSFALPGANLRNDGEINFRYDRIGNMLLQTSTLNHQENGLPVANLGRMDSGGGAGRWNRHGRALGDPPGPHALTSISSASTNTVLRSYPYDSNGNMTNIDGMVCSWDFKDRLVAVENSEMRANYTYDYSDRRILKRVDKRPGSTNPEPVVTVTYVNKYFEVREHEAPVKYVWDGDTRVARVTGSLNTTVRIQRLRVYSGWNLCSLAVSSANTLSQLSNLNPQLIASAFRWNPIAQDWEPMASNAGFPAGTVLWIKAVTNATVSVTGTYVDPTNRTVSTSGDFLPGAGLEAWDLRSTISSFPSLIAWTYDASFPRWLSWLPPPLGSESDLPAFIAPGQAVFARADVPIQLDVPESALRIRYYHQDHVGSSSSLSDAQGKGVEENAFFPFGQPRHEFRTSRTKEAYQFAQKERDFESKLHYVEARFLTASLSRFTRVDPMAIRLEPAILDVPQGLNPYAYSLNNPLKFHDPTGEVLGLLGKVVKVAIKGGDIASTVAGIMDDIQTLRSSNVSGWAKAGAALSLASEVLSPVSIKDAKAGVKIVNAAMDGGKQAGNLNDARKNLKTLGKADEIVGGTAKDIHKNSLNYVGETHVYRIKGPNGTHKIGESAQGVRGSDGASIRAEQQARRLTRETGDQYFSEIRKTFPDKASARQYETKLIERFRRMHGDDALPGNKNNR